MVVGVLRIVLQIPGAASLKGKRQVVRSLADRLRSRFNVAVAEVGENDRWQKAVFGIAAVGNDRAFVNEVLDKVLHAVDGSGLQAVIVSHELEILSFGDMYGADAQRERTLAEAEGLFRPRESEEDLEDEELPTLEELEAAAASFEQASPAPRRRRR